MRKRYVPTQLDIIFDEMEGANDRAAISVSGSLLDFALEEAIMSQLREPQSKESDKLFGDGGIAGSFSAKIWMAYFLGIIGPQSRRDIDLIRLIRNAASQSECCHGRSWVNFWLHGEFLELDKDKMSKSTGGFLHLDQIVADGFTPLDYRYLLLTTHYRSRLRFSYDSLEGAKRSRAALLNLVRRWRREKVEGTTLRSDTVTGIQSQFCEHLSNDLHLPAALAFAWTIARDSNISAKEKHEIFSFFDRAFGLDLDAEGEIVLTETQASLIEAREEARRRKDWNTADRLRGELFAQGVHLCDGPEGPEWDIIPSRTP